MRWVQLAAKVVVAITGILLADSVLEGSWKTVGESVVVVLSLLSRNPVSRGDHGRTDI